MLNAGLAAQRSGQVCGKWKGIPGVSMVLPPERKMRNADSSPEKVKQFCGFLCCPAGLCAARLRVQGAAWDLATCNAAWQKKFRCATKCEPRDPRAESRGDCRRQPGHGCFVAPQFSESPATLRDVAQQASGVKRVRKVVKPKAKVKKLGKSRQGSSEDGAWGATSKYLASRVCFLKDSVWNYITEKDKAALEEGAFMETFAGKAVETTVIYPRAAPTYNPMDNVAVMEGNEVAY
eukprot:Skav233897  [mRNA]  locus=scaffold435:297637:300556:+ [translate_table: standard]